MNPSKEVLDNKLAEFERASNCSELEIYLELGKLRNGDIEDEPCPEWVYESMAFNLYGSTHANEDAITYWEKRSQSTNNPLLKAQYAGLVWDLSLTATGKRPHYSLAHRCCEAIFGIAERRSHKYDVDVIKKLKRALSIAISLNSVDLIQRTKEAILEYEDIIAEDSKPGLWGFSFDLLVGDKKVDLSNEEERKIIDGLEARLERLKDGEPWACEHAAERLARYYRTKGLDGDCSRVVKTWGGTFENAAKNVAPLLASSWLEHAYHFYDHFNLKTDAERVSRSIRKLGPKMHDEMKDIYHEMEIPPEEFDAYVEQMVDGDLEQALKRIANQYIPPREEVENQLHDLAQKAPISFLFSRRITDHQGRMVAVVDPLEDDLDGNVVRQISHNMDISAMFLSTVLDKAISKFSLTDEVILDYLFQAPIFTPQQKEFLSKGIRAYLEKEYVVAVHLLIPQIEAAIRNLVEMSGGAVLEPRQGGGFHLLILEKSLRSEQVKYALGEDTTLYFRVVLTDQRGWNIRNDVCHGLSPYDRFSKSVADRLMHILLVLAQLRIEEAMTGLKIVPFDEQYAADFKRLNLVWLERYFSVEPIDLEVLSNPEETIVNPGGMVFFALLDGTVVGTCALIKHNDGLFELSKMAVADTHQGKGIGTQLLRHLIAWARSQSIQKLFVETNTVLERAVRLYHRVGFREIAHDSSDAHYDRTNLKMELEL